MARRTRFSIYAALAALSLGLFLSLGVSAQFAGGPFTPPPPSPTAIDGTGAANQIAYFSDANTLQGSSTFRRNVNGIGLAIGSTGSNGYDLEVERSASSGLDVAFQNLSAGAGAYTSVLIGTDTRNGRILSFPNAAAGSAYTGVTKANAFVIQSGASSSFSLFTETTSPLNFGTNSTLRGFFASDGGFHLKSSSAAVSAAGDIALRNNGGVFEVSQNGGAYAAPVGSGAGWQQTMMAAGVARVGLTAATMGCWFNDHDGGFLDDPSAWDINRAGTTGTTAAVEAPGGQWSMTAAGSTNEVVEHRAYAGLGMAPASTGIWYFETRFKISANPATANGYALVRLAGAGNSITGVGYLGAGSTTHFVLFNYDGNYDTQSTTVALDTEWHTWGVGSDGTNLYVTNNGTLVLTRAFAAWSTPAANSMVPSYYIDRTGDSGNATALTVIADRIGVCWGQPA